VTAEDTERITLAGNAHLGLDSIDRATEVEPSAVQRRPSFRGGATMIGPHA
jgi:hypothetical protein